MSHAYQAPAESAARTAAGLHRIGIVLDLVGSVLAALALALVVAQAIGVTWASGANDNRQFAEWVLATADRTVSVPGVMCLFAMCALIPGEMLRRGTIGPSGSARQTLLPRGSFIAVFRPIGLRVHTVWALILLIAAFSVVIPAAASVETSSWPASVTHDGAYTVVNSILTYGLLLAGIAGATLGSVVKKFIYSRTVERNGGTPPENARGQAFWAWFTMRWRFDLWLCGVGVLGLAGCAIPFSTSDVGIGLAVLLVAMVLTAAGLFAAGNYWRAGAPLGVGESVS